MAAPDGKISVELQLIMDTAMKQVQAATSAMAKEFAKVGMNYQPGKLAADTDKVTTAENKATAAVKERTKATRELSAAQQRLKDIASGKLSPVQPGQTVTIAGTNATNKTYGPGAIIPGGIGGNSTATPPLKTLATPSQIGTVANPMNNMLRRQLLLQPQFPTGGFPKLPNAVPQPNAFKQIAPLLAAAIGTGVGGPLGGAIAGVLTKMNPAVAAVTAGMTALRYAAAHTAEAFERARGIYAKSVSSGFGVGQTVQRNMLAQAIGVSENDIYQYGAAIAQLNGKLAVAMRTITQTNGPLTAVAWDFSVLGENLKALWAKIAAAMAPAVDELVNLISAFAKLNILSGNATVLGTEIGFLIDYFTKLVAVISLIPATFQLAMTVILDSVRSLADGIQNYLASTKLGKLMGVDHVQGQGFKDTKDAFSAYKDILKTIVTNPKMPDSGTPMAFMKQLPASNWEHMGLQIGAGGGQNYQQQTAANTKKTNAILDKLHQAITANKFNSTMPQGIPAGA